VTANEQQAKYWSERSSSWLAAERRLELVSGDAGAAAMDCLPLKAGHRVVDLGCGSGRTTVELARRVAPGGAALGVDISPEMVAFAQAHAGDTAAEFLTADVQDRDLGDGAFDAAYSRFGVMFFSDPVVAFTNVRRSLRDDGVLAFACWRTVFENDWMLLPVSAAMAIMGASLPMPGPGEPGPFSLADPDHVRLVLGAAGFGNVSVDLFDEPMVISQADVASFAEQTANVGAVREVLTSADEDTRHGILAAIEEALTAKVSDGELKLSRGVNIVTAR
jgi:SAM-dependent methyltransferase